MYSLRRTLAARFSLTIFVALLLIALWAYLGQQRVLRKELDRDLAAAAHLELAFLDAGFPLHPDPQPSSLPAFIEEVNRFVVVRDSTGAITGANTHLATSLPLNTSAFERARSGAAVWVSQDWAGSSVRSLFLPVGSSARRAAVIQVAASFEPHQARSRELLVLMLGTVLLGTIATGVGARWLASSSLRPVTTITDQARAIRGGATGQRITAYADTEELAGLVAVLNQMLERLDAAFVAQRRLIANAGHDLRTPLTAMRGELEVALRAERSAATYAEILKSQLEEVEHLIALAESLIMLARLDSGELVPNRRLTDLGPVVERAVERARGRAPDRVIQATLTDGSTADVDGGMIELALDHLLDNGLRHTPPDAAISVSVEGDPGGVTLHVDDSGPGLADTTFLFERFYRADTARTRPGGPGLGLSITTAIVEAHRGQVSASRSPLGGLRVSLRFPPRLPS